MRVFNQKQVYSIPLILTLLVLLSPWSTGQLISHRGFRVNWVDHPYWLQGPEWDVYRVERAGRIVGWSLIGWHVWAGSVQIEHWWAETLDKPPRSVYWGLWDGRRLRLIHEERGRDFPWVQNWPLWWMVRSLPGFQFSLDDTPFEDVYTVLAVISEPGTWSVWALDRTHDRVWRFQLDADFPYAILWAEADGWTWRRISHTHGPTLRGIPGGQSDGE